MVWPAAVTPFNDRGRIDYVSLARLFAFFEAAGCTGVVLGGTTGEGPSLSAVEKRDLIRESVRLRGSLQVILGSATNSLDEAIWLSKRAVEFGATGLLAAPPSFFRGASAGLRDWYLALMEGGPSPVVVYHHPAFVGVSLGLDDWADLLAHENCLGVKASSGYDDLLSLLPSLAPGKMLLMGNEADLGAALSLGWSGTISAVANVIPHWLVQVVREHPDPHKLAFLEPVLAAIRSGVMPGNLKSVLTEWGILERADVRLPLTCAGDAGLGELIHARLGMSRKNLGLPRPVDTSDA